MYVDIVDTTLHSFPLRATTSIYYRQAYDLHPFREFNLLPVRFGTFNKDWEAPLSTAIWNPAADIFENENEVVIKAELPGMDVKDIDVRFENNVLTLKGERHFEKETKDENYSLQAGVACLEKLRRQTLEAQILALKASIKDAERAGKVTEALRLYEDLHRFERSQRAASS